MDSISSWKIFLPDGLTVAYGGSMLPLHKPWTAFRKGMVDTASRESPESLKDMNSDIGNTDVVDTNISGIDHRDAQAHKCRAARGRRRLWEIEVKVSRMFREVLNQTRTGTTNQAELLASFQMAVRDMIQRKNWNSSYAMQWMLFGDGPGDYIYSDDECDDLLMM